MSKDLFPYRSAASRSVMLAAASEAATSDAAPTAEATREATDDAGEPFWVRAATLNWKKKVSFPHKIAN